MKILPGPPAPRTEARDAPLRAAATRLEATFLSEMLKSAKFGEPRGSFGGGIGEEQYASLLRDRIAGQMAETGGIGLGAQIFQALRAADDRA